MNFPHRYRCAYRSVRSCTNFHKYIVILLHSRGCASHPLAAEPTAALKYTSCTFTLHHKAEQSVGGRGGLHPFIWV